MNFVIVIVFDIKGFKIRIYNFVNGGVIFNEGDEFVFVCGEEIFGDEKRCLIFYEEFYKDI